METDPKVLLLVNRPELASGLSAALEARAIPSLVLDHSDALYSFLNSRSVDGVVVENELPGFLTGIEILDRIYQDLLRPETILLAPRTNEIQERANDIGIAHVIDPSTSIEDLASHIESSLLRSDTRCARLKTEARHIVRRAGEIPAMPQVLVRIADHLDSGTSSIEEVIRDIAIDPKVTADLLKVANSPRFGASRTFTKLFDAVNYLGVHRSLSLIVSRSIASAQRRMSLHIPSIERLRYNQRSVLIASTAEVFAETFEGVSPDTAHVVGLLQDIGMLVLAKVFGRKYMSLQLRVRDVGHLRLEVLENEAFGVTHADVSAALLQMWDFPVSVVSLIGQHHSERIVGHAATVDQTVIHLMRVGEALANLADGHTQQRFPILSKLLSKYPKTEALSSMHKAIKRAKEASELLSVNVPKTDPVSSIVSGLSEEMLDQRDEQPIETVLTVPEREPPAPPPPAAPPSITANVISKPQAPPAAGGSQLHFLVVEDDQFIAQVIDRCLEVYSGKVTACQTIAEAKLHAPAADILFVDVHLGGEDGIQLIEQLRQEGCKAPIVVVSGDRTRSTVGNALLVGANDYVLKPFTEESIREKVDRHLELVR
ncbi:Swarming motility regulation protein RssB [Planctomycetes bacterium Pan216]|uniref:Swarming motility regulation protein RssB n=1 Tax=Kolteria novifilia TaxID=2527975 RepID=A0A518BBQ0_9BACT|nr:Swarming motility regulation protein RssB [Planctomycetes bacterium Pan216]